MALWTVALAVLVTALAVSLVPTMMRPKFPSSKVTGFTAPGWKDVADVFRQSLSSGVDHGLQVAVYHEGQLVVELAGGYADEEAHWEMQKDTLLFSAAVTQAVAAVVIAMLVDKGLLGYDKPVSHYWPEFAKNGKDDVTVEQLLSHQAGLAAAEEQFEAADFFLHPESFAESLARQAPNWELGTTLGYHGISMIPLMDQLVKLVDPLHRDLGQFFEDEVEQKFGVDFHFGLPLEENYRCARMYPVSPLNMDTLATTQFWETLWSYFMQPSSLTRRSLSNPKGYSDASSNNPDYRACPYHGFSTAIGIAKLMGLLANGGQLDGKTLLSEKLVGKLNQPLISGKDEILKMNVTYGPGVTLKPTSAGGWIFGAPVGRQMGYADPDKKLGWSYLTNQLSTYATGEDSKYLALKKAMYDTLKKLQSS